MRNLSLLSVTLSSLPKSYDRHQIQSTTFDLDEGITYVASECIVEQDVNVQVWRTQNDGELSQLAEGIFPFSGDLSRPQIISLTIVAETRTLCLIMRCGDIAILPLDISTSSSSSPSQILDTIGTIDPTPVLAASFSSDSSLLTIVAGAASNTTLLLMDPVSFDVIISSPIITKAYGSDAPVNVGWGSKSTQFHGSLGKAAAQASAPQASTTSPDDDGSARISWRGDAQYFSVSIVENRKRVLRIYDRNAALQNTAEDAPGLEGSLAWRPNGGLIASTQRFGKIPGAPNEEWGLGKGKDGRHDVVFFERNGLRHGEFSLREVVKEGRSIFPWGYRVKELGWNADSTILSVWIEREQEDVVQLWTASNYHYYLKIEIPASSPTKSRFSGIAWHPEDSSLLVLTTPDLIVMSRFIPAIASSPLQPPNDTGLVAVVDGQNLLLTPFRTQNVPPPMSTHRLTLQTPSPPVSVAFLPIILSPSSPKSDKTELTDILSTLSLTNVVSIYSVHTYLPSSAQKGKREALSTKLLWAGRVGDGLWPRQTILRNVDGGLWVGVLSSDEKGCDCIVEGKLKETAAGWEWALGNVIRRESKRGRIVEDVVIGGDATGAGSVVLQDESGALFEYAIKSKTFTPMDTSFPTFSPIATRVFALSLPTPLFIAFSSSTLYAASRSSLSATSLKLTTSCSSYTIAGYHLIYTTTSPAHESHYILLSSIHSSLTSRIAESEAPKPIAIPESAIEKRRVERGSRIVTVVPSTMNLVLQMPRGNLETVNPRALVLGKVAEDVKSGDYRSAFIACRKHRVDLNLLVTLDQERFEKSVATFIEQIDDVEYINLFLSNLGRSSDLPQETISRLCDSLRTELEKKDLKKYVNSILTGHVVKTPPDLESGLGVLVQLRETNAELVDEAVKYIIFLVDADKLFDTALGMYDFSLVLLVAQYSQKDPREYLPFLRTLSSLSPPPYQHFKINDHLKRHAKALSDLHEAGKIFFEEAKAYVEKHRLYTDALKLWSGDKKPYAEMLQCYGDWLFERREFAEAGLAFAQAGKPRKAMIAYEKSLQWQEVFEIVVSEGLNVDEREEIARRVADDLATKQRYVEAARVLFDYADDVNEGVASLVRGGAWSEARRIVALQNRPALLTEVILPGALEAVSSISDEITQISELLEKQVNRLDELTKKKAEEPDTFYGMDDSNLANVDVMTDVSHPGTTFTRYTAAPTTSSRSNRTSRSKRKLDRKAGRKGTVEEEEYLLKSLTKLVTRLEVILNDARTLIPHLSTFSPEHIQEGITLQYDLKKLQQAMVTAIDRVWEEREESLAAPEKLDAPPVKLIQKVPKPIVEQKPLGVGWIETLC